MTPRLRADFLNTIPHHAGVKSSISFIFSFRDDDMESDGHWDTNDENESGAVPYKLISKKGKMLGTVNIIKTDANELVHGHTLKKSERKVLVTGV